MRVALLASTFALLAGSPAFAQCIYVGCSGGQPAPGYQQPAYQQPAYQPPVYRPAPPAPGAERSTDYDDGYAAGLAARRPVAKARHQHAAARPARHVVATRKVGGTHGVARRSGGNAQAARNHVAVAARPRAVRAVQTAAPRQVAPRRAVAQQVTRNQMVRRQNVPVQRNNGPTNYGYQDPIKDRAASYRPNVYGQSTSMSSLMTQSSSYRSTSVSWVGPAQPVAQGGQVCGWGARVVTNAQGYAQRQAVWVCQCPQGWRPPGY